MQDMQDISDAELIKQATRGDARAFERLCHRHYDLMFRIAFKWCGHRATAEDITQNACIKLATALRTYQGKAAFTTWLYRLVINTAIDMQRAEKRHHHAQGEMDDVPGPDNPEAAYYAQEIMRAIGRLPAKEKAALLLVFGEGMNHAEAAFVMEVKESTVSWYIFEARKKLEEFKNEERRHG